MASLTDTHCHLNLNIFQQDLAEVLERAWDTGLERILIPGIDLETSITAIELASKDSRLFAAVGFHPNEVEKWTRTSIKALEALAQSSKVVAIGEIGLDFYWNKTPMDKQLQVLSEQLELAALLQKPVVIHSRDSIATLAPILRTWQAGLVTSQNPLAGHPGVCHSYEGNEAIGLDLIKANYFLGISGPITFKNATARQITLSQFPIEALVLETDAPFLTPHPNRGERNEPRHVYNIAQRLADLKQLDVDQVAQITSQNAQNLFTWK